MGVQLSDRGVPVPYPSKSASMTPAQFASGGGGAGGYRASYNNETSGGGGSSENGYTVIANGNVNYLVSVAAGGVGNTSGYQQSL